MMYRVELSKFVAGSGIDYTEVIDNMEESCTAEEYVEYMENFDNPDDPLELANLDDNEDYIITIIDDDDNEVSEGMAREIYAGLGWEF